MNGITLITLAIILILANKLIKQRQRAELWKQSAIDLNRALNDGFFNEDY